MEDPKLNVFYNKALRYLMIRPRSIFEISQYFSQKGANNEQIKTLIQVLSEQDYLNDENFAKLWCNSRVQTKFLGPFRLKMELKLKKIPEEYIEKAITDAFLVDPPLVIATKALSYKCKNIDFNFEDPSNLFKVKSKLIAFLQRKGFDYSISSSALEIFLADILEKG